MTKTTTNPIENAKTETIYEEIARIENNIKHHDGWANKWERDGADFSAQMDRARADTYRLILETVKKLAI